MDSHIVPLRFLYLFLQESTACSRPICASQLERSLAILAVVDVEICSLPETLHFFIHMYSLYPCTFNSLYPKSRNPAVLILMHFCNDNCRH
ncbi:uncharacterized protein EV420DRAFT_473495 [Desarmillaria tabescens]|uniref:Uncharacterized protein n=1 Tax=Armillaria tabescens TaxID=1929756 RepID=A0AA39KF87_ARMTA|nr:uncharacterized protein EV420DRAFT_473495 [Desarmillaria tabescens]KAK0457693.1 hypothetical protein EV420DRAFT_473495 [Desarmillaria tabescens]